MSQNSENEFENLFKRAGENYPINSSNANWNEVLSALEEDSKKKRFAFFFNKKSILFGMLLLAVGICSSIITGLIVWNSSSNKKNNPTENITKNNLQQSTTNEKKIASDVYEKVMREIKNNSISEKSMPEIEKRNTKNKGLHIAPINTANLLLNKSKVVISNSRDTLLNQKNTENIIPPNIESSKLNSENESVAVKEISTDSSELLKIDKSNAENSNELVNKPVVKIKNGTKYFYGGVLFAKDKSSIKLEPNKGTGYSVALMLGYHFSKNWSIESGLHIEKKELYTTGANFDKSILQATGNIVWIESEARLLEIPITIKRDLFTKKKHNLFTTIGLSSFIVNKESIEYEEEVGGVLQSENVVFNKNTSNIFSTLNLSLGYQYKLWKIGNIRIEPYFNIPIGVIGKGKTPVYSKGIYIGWTFDFHNNSLKH